MEFLKRSWHKTPKSIRQLLVLLVGVLFIVAGMIMWFIPGPGWAAIFIGFAILATEFAWADRVKQGFIKVFKHLADMAKKIWKKRK